MSYFSVVIMSPWGALKWFKNEITLNIFQRTLKFWSINLVLIVYILFFQYNVEKAGDNGGGGEYESQIGFGWSNGVVFEMMDRYATELSSATLTRWWSALQAALNEWLKKVVDKQIVIFSSLLMLSLSLTGKQSQVKKKFSSVPTWSTLFCRTERFSRSLLVSVCNLKVSKISSIHTMSANMMR